MEKYYKFPVVIITQVRYLLTTQLSPGAAIEEANLG